MAIAAVNASSSTASNWLKEAQDAIAASESPGGMMGALQDARSGYSLKTFIAKSQNSSYALAQIAQSGQQSAGQLAVQMSQAAAQKRYNEQVELQVKLNPVHQNFNAPKDLDPVIYFNDGASSRHQEQRPDHGGRQQGRHHHGPQDHRLRRVRV